ncbi:NfeD family protein [Velocimicrobium porci]|uniref:NfeD family protein n=1 Tax=Velocimicrobium porci TaxID=2606634 RepID=A0A6L5Y041_9FIRM|nr:NfeD family protein [Velocimicrobium porci]MSS63808.1 NfeD family protein [Velocimicrobium porci]
MEPVYWLIALVVLLIIEIVTLGLTTIWFAGGALVAFLVAMLGMNTVLQVIVFLAVSFLLLFFTRPIATKYFNGQRIRTNSESLIGQEAKVTAKIDNFNQQGTVVVNGQEWSARTVDDQIIEPGEPVIILEISGVKLIVKEKEEQKWS